MATKPGDHVFLYRSDGKCDLFTIDESGERVWRREAPVDQVDNIASGIEGQVWEGDQATPDVLKPYKRGIPWGPKKP
jgi:hypothetical protein